MVTVQLDDKWASPSWPNEAGQRLVVNHKRSDLGEEIKRVGDQVIKVCGQRNIEPAALKRYQLREASVPESGKPPVA